MKGKQLGVFLFALIFLNILWPCASAAAQTDMALSMSGAFGGGANGLLLAQRPAGAVGGMVELRHIRSELVGYEATYSFHRANQSYATVISCSAPGCQPGSVSANGHEITGDWVASFKFDKAHLRPFALVGAGIRLEVPTGATPFYYCGAHLQCGIMLPATTTSTEAVMVYGAGLDWGILPRVGLRLQYREDLNKAPALSNDFAPSGRWTHASEPAIGAYFRF